MCAATWTRAALAAAFSLIAGDALADCRNLSFEDTRYTVCEAQPGDTIRTYLDAGDGQKIGTFERLKAEAEGRIVFAMNAGMYHADRSPVGLYIENGQKVRDVVRRKGPGNFGMLPNGVLCVKDGAARVMATDAWTDTLGCDFATQSGPMLVIDGKLHPRFIDGSTSTYVRNGVGILPDGRLVAAISNDPVNFHDFARLFRDGLGVRNALFLDGNISRLYAPAIGRADLGFPLGPMLAVTR